MAAHSHSCSFGGPAAGDDGNAAYILHASGSTGTPHGVIIEHLNVVHTMIGAAQRYAISHRNTSVVLVPLVVEISCFEMPAES